MNCVDERCVHVVLAFEVQYRLIKTEIFFWVNKKTIRKYSYLIVLVIFGRWRGGNSIIGGIRPRCDDELENLRAGWTLEQPADWSRLNRWCKLEQPDWSSLDCLCELERPGWSWLEWLLELQGSWFATEEVRTCWAVYTCLIWKYTTEMSFKGPFLNPNTKHCKVFRNILKKIFFNPPSSFFQTALVWSSQNIVFSFGSCVYSSPGVGPLVLV